jgi:hypothetical protein
MPHAGKRLRSYRRERRRVVRRDLLLTVRLLRDARTARRLRVALRAELRWGREEVAFRADGFLAAFRAAAGAVSGLTWTKRDPARDGRLMAVSGPAERTTSLAVCAVVAGFQNVIR